MTPAYGNPAHRALDDPIEHLCRSVIIEDAHLVAMDLIRDAARRWVRAYGPVEPYSTGENIFLQFAESAYFDAAEIAPACRCHERREPEPPASERLHPVNPLTGTRRYQTMADIVERDGWGCTYCVAELTMKTATIDHVVARFNGGSNDLDNLVLACAPCNSSKGVR